MIVVHDRKDLLCENRIQRYEEGRQNSRNSPDQAEVEFSVGSHNKSTDDDAKAHHGFAGSWDAKKNAGEEDVEDNSQAPGHIVE
mmetsp:Transcript_11823/g.21849  ORF Transcript_11823/g.21849 Transcript_11823/m.21849 type:complete len:84 (+) Transcript_11823:699-950(+)